MPRRANPALIGAFVVGAVTLAVVGLATGMRVGTAIANVYTRGPATLALSAAGLAEIAPGVVLPRSSLTALQLRDRLPADQLAGVLPYRPIRRPLPEPESDDEPPAP